MKLFMRCVGVIGTIGLVAVSLTMNFRFGQSLGKTEWDGLVYGTASGCADGFKVILPFAVAYAWRSSRYLATFFGVILLVMFTAYSMTSSLGHSATNRAEVAGEKRHDISVYGDVKHAISVKQREREQLQGFRPVAAVQAEIGNKELDRRWQWSKRCSMPASSDARMFCAAVLRLNAELATALRAAELDRELDALRQKLERSGGSGATGEADAQVALIGDLLGINEDNVRLTLTLLVSLMVELGSGLGLFVIFDEQVRRQGEGGSVAAPPQSAASKLVTARKPVEVEWLKARVVKASEEAYESESALFRDYCAFIVEHNAGPALSLGAFRSFLQQQQIGLIVRKAGRNYICGIRLREGPALANQAV